MTIPVYQLTFPGGDTQGVGNFEYRIPIVGPVILAAFFDAGINKISRASQLGLNPGRITRVERAVPAGRLYRPRPDCCRDPSASQFDGSGASGHDAGGECAVPVLLGL